MRLVGRAFVGVMCWLLLLGAASAQDLTPASEALLSGILTEVAAQPDDVARQHSFLSHLPELDAAGSSDPVLAFATAYLSSRLAGDAAVQLALQGVTYAQQKPLTEAMFVDATVPFAEAMAASSQGITPTPLQLYQAGLGWNNISEIGKDLIGSQLPPETKTLIDNAIKTYKAGKALDDYVKGNDKDVSKIIGAFVDLIPASVSPAFSGPAGVAFGDLMTWNAGMWNQTTQGIDLINDAMRTGQLDQDRLGQITQQLKLLAGQGPWGSDTARKMIANLLDSFPKLKALFNSLWPEQPKSNCDLINCNCGAIEAGILTGGWRDACRQGEASLKAQCQASGVISGSCGDPAGPGAFPP